jgi:hypothetical protein
MQVTDMHEQEEKRLVWLSAWLPVEKKFLAIISGPVAL